MPGAVPVVQHMQDLECCAGVVALQGSGGGVSSSGTGGSEAPAPPAQTSGDPAEDAKKRANEARQWIEAWRSELPPSLLTSNNPDGDVSPM